MNLFLPTSRRYVRALGAGTCVAGLASRVNAASPPRAIVELFTSQGGSSCPPADAFMEDLMAMDRIIAMSFNVDYWDYLGWRDTLASPANSQRQYSYAKTRGDMDVYTPQVIVDGSTHFVGSNRPVIKAAIGRSLASTRSTWIPMAMTSTGKEIVIRVDAVPAGMHPQDATVWFMAIAPEVAVKIERGENAGREMVYRNVERKLVPAGMWHGEQVTLNLPKDDLMIESCKG